MPALMATPYAAGEWIDGNEPPWPADSHAAARVVLTARDYGYPGTDDEEPGVDIIALAERDMAGELDQAGDEYDALIFRYANWAEEWLDRNAAPPGHNFGWCNGVFYLQSITWWETETTDGRPDQMWLP